MRIGNERLCKVRFGRHHAPATARSPFHPAEEALADAGIGDRIVRRADGGRRPKSIREISVEKDSKRDTLVEKARGGRGQELTSDVPGKGRSLEACAGPPGRILSLPRAFGRAGPWRRHAVGAFLCGGCDVSRGDVDEFLASSLAGQGQPSEAGGV